MSGPTNDVLESIKHLPEEQQKAIMAAWDEYQNSGSQEGAAPAEEADSTFYAENYNPLPESPSIGTQVKSGLKTASDFLGFTDEDKPSEAQQEVEQYEQDYDKAMADREATYKHVGREADSLVSPEVAEAMRSPSMPLSVQMAAMLGGELIGDQRVQQARVPNPDFNADVEEGPDNPRYTYREMYVPKPDSNAFTRGASEIMTRVAEGVGDLIVDQKFIEEGSVSEALPNIPQSSGEALATEIASYLIPGLGARKAAVGTAKLGAKGIDALKRMNPETAKKAKAIYDEAIKNGESVTKAGNKVKAFLTEALAGAYAISGEVLITPPDATPMFMDPKDVQEVTGMDPDNAKALATAIESSALGTGIKYTALAIGKGYDALAAKGKGFLRASTKATKGMYENANAMAILQTVDPDIASSTAPVTALRMRIFAEEVGKKEVIDVLDGLEGAGKAEVRLDSTSAVIQAAENYVRRAYTYKIDELGQEGFEQFVKDKTVEMANNMVYMRMSKGYLPGVLEAEARMADDIAGNLNERVSDISGVEAGAEGAETLAEGPIKEAFNRTGRSLAEDQISEVRLRTDRIADIDDEIARLEDMKANGIMEQTDLGELLSQFDPTDLVGTKTEQIARIRKLMGEDAFSAWKASSDRVKAAYDAFPDGTPIDTRGLAESIDKAVQNVNKVDDDGTKVGALLGRLRVAFKIPASIRKAGPDSEKATEFFERLDERMSGPNGIDFKYLYNTVKPDLEILIQEAKQKGDIGVAKSLIELKRSITDDQLEWLKANGSPEIADMANAADREYTLHANNWMASPDTPMGGFDKAAQQRASLEARAAATTDPKKREALQGKATDEFNTRTGSAFEQMEAELGSAGAGFDTVIRAIKMSTDNDVSPEIAEYYGAQALRALYEAVETGAVQDAKMLNSALNRSIPKLEAVNSPLLPKIKEAKQTLEMLDMNVGASVDSLTALKASMEDEIAALNTRTVAKFIDKGTGDPLYNPKQVVDNLLSAPNAGNQLEDLMRSIDELPPAEALAGRAALKGVLLQEASDRVFTYARTFLTGVGKNSDKAYSELSSARRASSVKAMEILRGETDQTLSNLAIVFKDDPMQVTVYRELIGMLEAVEMPKRLKINPSGQSDTFGLKESSSAVEAGRTAIILAFGVLNPTATMARNLSAGTLKAMDELAKTIDDDVMGELLKNPKVLSDMAKRLAEGMDPDSVVNMFGPKLLTNASGRLTRATYKAVDREPERTPKQDDPVGYTGEEDYRSYIDAMPDWLQ